MAPSLHIHGIEAGAAGDVVKAGASSDNLRYTDCWGHSELLGAARACPVTALCLLRVLFFVATQWGQYHYYSNCPEDRLLSIRRKVMKVSTPALAGVTGVEGSFRSGRQWAEEAAGLSCCVQAWLRGVTEREVSIMTPRFLSWVTGWIILPCADMRTYTDFPFGTVWTEVSGQHPTGKSHEWLDILVWAWARCQVENSESSSHKSACLYTHKPGKFFNSLLHSQKFQ